MLYDVPRRQISKKNSCRIIGTFMFWIKMYPKMSLQLSRIFVCMYPVYFTNPFSPRRRHSISFFFVCVWLFMFVYLKRSEWIATAGLNMLNAIQNLIITLGFTAGSLLCAWFVSEGREGMTVGDYVLFCSYVLQLYTPLNQLGAFYRWLDKHFQ